MSTARFQRMLTTTLMAGVVATSALGQSPDLVALSVQGPDSVQIGGNTNVNTFIVNLGSPLIGSIDFEILLSTDLVIDSSDVLLQSVSIGFVGAVNNPVTIPSTLTPGAYNWALRVLPTAGESKLFNNQIVGGQVNLFEIDLCVDDASPVQMSALKGGDNPGSHTIHVSNCGSGSSVMIFTAAAPPDAPWLSVTPGTSFALANGTPQAVEIRANTDGLDVGVYQSQVLLQNFNKPSDFEIIPVTLTLGEASFAPGDTLLGEIEVNEVDDAKFEAVQGMKLTVSLTTTFGNLKPTVEILDDQGGVVESWKFKSGSNHVKKTLKFKQTGDYSLRVTGRKGTIGSYDISTSQKLPKKGQNQSLKLKPSSGLVGSVKVMALSSASINFEVNPTKSFSGPLSVRVVGPQGEEIVTTGDLVPTAKGGLGVVDFPLPDKGLYQIEISGYGSSNELVKVTVSPQQPSFDASIVVVP